MGEQSRQILAVLEAARRKLVETGTRNRLVHVNRQNQRANCLNIINERSDDVFELLRCNSQRMRFKAMGKDKQSDGEGMLLAPPDETLEEGSARYTDNFLETPLGPEALARRLLRLAGSARAAEEEQGINILYLALGFLRWKESESSEIQREAPLLLLPVELVRNERTSTYDIRCRDDDLATNLPLQQRLVGDFGIHLPDIEENEGWHPSDYFARVADVVSTKSGWSVDEDGMQLGFFSFAKLLMHRDLDPANWPDGAFGKSDLLGGLLHEGFEADEPLFGPEDKLDALLDPAEIVQVVDADASQTKVIEEVRKGSSLVVQGPPGTGKSQTITNIIAAAAHDGKSVLFVAEKMAALSVVHQRLVRTGLRDICLELHSRAANKKALAQELGRTLVAATKPLPVEDDSDALRKQRDTLNRLASLLHTPLRPGNDTPFETLAELTGLIGRDAPPPVTPLAGLEALNQGQRAALVDAIGRLVEALDAVGEPDAHPFAGTTVHNLQPTDIARLSSEVADAVAQVDLLRQEADVIAGALGLPCPDTLKAIAQLAETLDLLAGAPVGAPDHAAALFDHVEQPRLAEALATGQSWRDAREAARPEFSDSAETADPGALRSGILRGQGSFFGRLSGTYRRASAELGSLLAGPLPNAPADRLALVDRLADLRRKRQALADEEAWLQATLGISWRGENTPFAELREAGDWIARIKGSGRISEAETLVSVLKAGSGPAAQAATLREKARIACAALRLPVERLGLSLATEAETSEIEDAPIVATRDRLARILGQEHRYQDWARLARARSEIAKGRGKAVLEVIEAGHVERARAAEDFLYACAESRWAAHRAAQPELDSFAHLDRHDIVEEFRELEHGHIEQARARILERHFNQIPRGTTGEMGIIRGEIGRKRGHKSIRWVMHNAGSMVQRIKPVMLMSPISVAQFLPPASADFDLLVIDEASQVRPEDALGVIARARQIVVVGDQKQLPPTSFFDRLVDTDSDEDEDEDAPVGASAADMESILTLCEAKGLRQRMLEWHYRSRDPSLIRISNAEFYGDGLVLPPSPLQLDENYGLKFNKVPGVYARGTGSAGRQGTNKIEAQAVVDAVARHARNWPGLSLGIVAFSKTQANMLMELLEFARRSDAVLDAFLREGRNEDVFVKNIENVQGDERDVILISVGYGPNEPNGRLPSMSFGPVNGEGGERRLNVLFSRARVRCEVFASFDPGEIDLNRTTREGPRVLKRFLEFAKSGVVEESVPTGLCADSPFEEDVARVILGLGYAVDMQVGSAGFRIDLGARHPDRPGQYILAVECDGATYHSALWARERDRQRQEVLEALGWRFHRIWSTDWFYNRAREIERLRAALNDASELAEIGLSVIGANEGELDSLPRDDEEPSKTADDMVAAISELKLTAPRYERANLTVDMVVEPHEATLPDLAQVVAAIVEMEGPIHEQEVARRVASAFGKQKAGKRIVDQSLKALRLARNKDLASIRNEGEIWLTQAQTDSPPVRDRSDEEGSVLKASHLPPIEIRAAARMIEDECGEMELEEKIRTIARLLGFRRVGSDLRAAILDAAT